MGLSETFSLVSPLYFMLSGACFSFKTLLTGQLHIHSLESSWPSEYKMCV